MTDVDKAQEAEALRALIVESRERLAGGWPLDMIKDAIWSALSIAEAALARQDEGIKEMGEGLLEHVKDLATLFRDDPILSAESRAQWHRLPAFELVVQGERTKPTLDDLVGYISAAYSLQDADRCDWRGFDVIDLLESHFARPCVQRI